MKKLGITSVVALLVMWPCTAYAAQTHLLYRVPAREKGRVAIDSSGHHHNGRLLGGVTRRDGAYKFHRLAGGRFDRITARNHPGFNPGFARFTYSVRLKVSPSARWLDTQMAVLRHGDTDVAGGDYKMELQRSPDGAVSAFCVIHDDDRHGAGFVRGRGGLRSIADGAWHTVACSRIAAQKVALTIDGNRVVRRTHGNLGRVKGDVPLLIGCQLKTDKVHFREQFVGKLDDISITVP